MSEFQEFPKLSRWSREVILTEKIDGTNAQIFIGEAGEFITGSRQRWIYPDKTQDNFGFSAWAHDNKNELLKLGPGRHFGEWYGQGIQRAYGLKEKRFALFNVQRWADATLRPTCCEVVATLERGLMDDVNVTRWINNLADCGSYQVPGFMRPEGVVLFHIAANAGFKKTIEKDEMPKSLAAVSA